MVGTRLRLGEERDLIERYRACTPEKERRIYYSQDCYIFHHVPAAKMKITYFVHRAFKSGQMRQSIKQIRQKSGGYIIDEAVQNRFGIKRILVGNRGINFPLRVLHITSLIAGILSLRIYEWLSKILSKV